MIPSSVTAWAGLVDDRHLGETLGFLQDGPYGLRLDGLVEMTLNEIIYSGAFRHLTEPDRRSEPGALWTTDAGVIPLERAEAPHEAETLLRIRNAGTANALALWFSAELAPGTSLSVGPGDPPKHWGMTTAPLRSPVELAAGMVVRARVRTAPARPMGTWTRWAIAMPGSDWKSMTSDRSGRRSTTERAEPFDPETSGGGVIMSQRPTEPSVGPSPVRVPDAGPSVSRAARPSAGSASRGSS